MIMGLNSCGSDNSLATLPSNFPSHCDGVLFAENVVVCDAPVQSVLTPTRTEILSYHSTDCQGSRCDARQKTLRLNVYDHTKRVLFNIPDLHTVICNSSTPLNDRSGCASIVVNSCPNARAIDVFDVLTKWNFVPLAFGQYQGRKLNYGCYVGGKLGSISSRLAISQTLLQQRQLPDDREYLQEADSYQTPCE